MNIDDSTTISVLKKNIEEFVSQIDWKKFHNPKDITESISIDAAKLLEIFQWISSENSIEYAKKNMNKINEKVAEVMIYCFILANALDIDISNAVTEKLEKNRKKYAHAPYW